MESKKFIWSNILLVAVGQVLCVGLMIGIFALAGHFAMDVIWGGLMGGVIAVANFTIMALIADKAAEKAQNQDVAGGQKLISLSYSLRMVLLFGALALCALSGVFNLIALAVPLVFNRPILTVAEIFRKKEGEKA